MENCSTTTQWDFKNEELSGVYAFTVRGVLDIIEGNLTGADDRPVIHLGRGDPSAFPCFRTTPVAEDAVVEAVRSAKFNCYAPGVGILSARRSIAQHVSQDLPYELSPDDIYLTAGANHAIEIVLRVLARPGANILLPKPGYPLYDACAAFSQLEVRYFDLLPEKNWEVDLDGVKALTDENTVAIVIINPGNPCGNVFKYEHLQKVVETAKGLGILVIADEVYGHLTFGVNPFVPMGVFGPIAPVLTLGTISKRWVVPGWRLGWIATTDPTGILQKSGLVKTLKSYINITADPATFIQGAIPQILENTTKTFFSKIVSLLKEAADICYDRLKEIPCVTCPQKPEGSMSVMVKLNPLLLDGISDDMDFCMKLAREESVIVLPGFILGLKNWFRVTFAIEPKSLEDGLGRMKAFCMRHAKEQ